MMNCESFKGWAMKFRLLITALLTSLALPCLASSLVYTPTNPSFGGSPLNGSILLNSATAQNTIKDSDLEEEEESALDEFNSRLQRSLLSRLTSSIAGNFINADGSLIPGQNTTEDFTIDVVDEGIEDRSWSLNLAQDAAHPLLSKYGRGLKIKKKVNDTATADIGKKARASSLRKSKNPMAKKSSILSNQKEIHKLPINQHVEVVREKGGKWVIQLMSSGSIADVLAFAKDSNISRSMYEYFYYEHKGEDRFAIIYGRFHNKARALKAIESLPPRLRIFEPWVRATHQGARKPA
jgi:curli production assembly/transport component CsgF